jgi:hypothetical protein
MDNVLIDLGETGWGGMDCIDLDQERGQCSAVVKSVMNFRVP